MVPFALRLVAQRQRRHLGYVHLPIPRLYRLAILITLCHVVDSVRFEGRRVSQQRSLILYDTLFLSRTCTLNAS